MAGRPSDYTPELAREICERIAAGESLRSICKGDDMPAESTVRGWVVDDREGFSAQYTRSRDIGLDCRADRIGERIETEGDVARARLLFDHERWYLSKLAPKRYGDKVQQEHTAPEGPVFLVTGVPRAADQT
jgi:hypothetical protein